jgi:hypothetical protein
MTGPDLKVVAELEEGYELVDIPVCPRCGGEHVLIACRHVKLMTFEADDYTRWVHVEFYRKPTKPSWWSRHRPKKD